MRKGQVWIETVLYTLIGLALIGVVLAIATPKINETKDRVVIEQTVEAMNEFDQKIYSAIEGSEGNVRKISAFKMKKGSLVIDKENNEIYFLLDDLGKPYSQPGEIIEDGRVNILTTENPSSYSVKVSISYDGIADIEYENTEGSVKYNAASTAYSFTLTNKGDSNQDLIKEIYIEEISGR
ncbi:MAG: hypothetical protein KC506_01815 [Nanoarchaeota archaeon]|nr:hypothetical protein [Nanoarchaeota archaeon]